MVEKWMLSKPNPYLSSKSKRPVFHTAPPKKFFYAKSSKSAYYGMPVNLFKDSDKDKVANVFDCKPYNKRKTDVISPANWGGGMTDMYARQEQARQQKLYDKQLEELKRLEEERLAELKRIAGESGSQTIITERTIEAPPTAYVYSPITGTYVTAESKEGKEAMKVTSEIIGTKKEFGGVQIAPSPSGYLPRVAITYPKPKPSTAEKVFTYIPLKITGALTPKPKSTAAKIITSIFGGKKK